jgi:hypothetical protein
MNTTQTQADKTVRNASGFQGWAELEMAMQRGYVPTLRIGTPKVDRLAALVIKNGYSYWNPSTGKTVSP